MDIEGEKFGKVQQPLEYQGKKLGLVFTLFSCTLQDIVPRYSTLPLACPLLLPTKCCLV